MASLEPWMIWGIAAGFAFGFLVFGAWSLFGGAGKRIEGFEEGSSGSSGQAGQPLWDTESIAVACPYFESAWKTSEAALKLLKEGGTAADPAARSNLEAFVAEYKGKCEQLGCPNTTRNPSGS